MSHLRAHSLKMEASFDPLMKVVHGTVLAIELFMQLKRRGKDDTTFLQNRLVFGIFRPNLHMSIRATRTC